MSRHPESESGEGFVGRWSRRKTASNAPTEAEQTNQVTETKDDPVPLNQVVTEHTPGRMQTTVEADRLKAELAPTTDDAPPAVLTDADMPAIESLDESSDFSGFLSPGVSEKLRRTAMRKLFSAAVFNVRDGLDDYDEDFTNFEPLGDIVTSDMKHQAEVAERRRREAEEAAAQAESDAQQDEAQQTAEDAADEEAPAADLADSEVNDDAAIAEDQTVQKESDLAAPEAGDDPSPEKA